VLSRRPIVGYSYVAASTVLTGVVGMGVWVHHMFAVGMGQMAMSFFAAASMTISLFTTIQIFAWIATIWSGKPVRTATFWFAIAFIATLVVGGLSGVVTGLTALNLVTTIGAFIFGVGILAFGGGVPLSRGKTRVGGLGASGDTACADHEIAKRIRDKAGLNPDGGPFADDIQYSAVDGPSLFSHPLCVHTYRNGKKIGEEPPAKGY
jgi:hypothetical protein